MEMLAFAICQMLTFVFFLIPISVVLMNGLSKKPEAQSRSVQLCAIYLVWNSHVAAHCFLVCPFVIQKVIRGASSRWVDVLYDVFVLFSFVCAPLELSTGMVKGLVSKKRTRFNWRHRAILGTVLIQVTAFFFIGSFYVRRECFELTIFMVFCFYAYALSYLPNQPQGDGPEIDGSREWPALKQFLRPVLFEPCHAYMRMKLIVDEIDCDVQAKDEADMIPGLDRVLKAAEGAREELASLLLNQKNKRQPYPRAHPLRKAQAETVSLSSIISDLKANRLAAVSEREKNGLLPGESAIFGFHVHGILPFNAALMTVLPDFCRREKCVVASDAYTHVVTGMRDLGQWLGSRECTREAIGKALNDDFSVVLVPGGQAEIFSTRSWGTTVFCYRGHRGFVRLALTHKKRLVPVFSFGEWELLDNVYWPQTQALTRKLIGFPMPFLPYGFLGLPLPRRPPKGITIVQGTPIDVEAFLDAHPAADNLNAIEQAVERAHESYFNQLHALFEKHKATAGYPHHELVFLDAPVHTAPSSTTYEKKKKTRFMDNNIKKENNISSLLPPPSLERNYSSWEDIRRRKKQSKLKSSQ